MKRVELVAQLEAAKSLTGNPTISIDNVVALIMALEPDVKVEKPKGFSLKGAQFDMLMDKIEEAVNNIDRRELVDKSSAEFELDWNNCISLTDVDIDTDYIYNTIREELEELVEEEKEDEALEEGTLKDIESDTAE